MRSITIKINEKIYDKFLWLLKQFNKNDIEIINVDMNYENNKAYLHNELQNISSGSSEFYSVNEAEQKLEKVIRKHEDSSK